MYSSWSSWPATSEQLDRSAASAVETEWTLARLIRSQVDGILIITSTQVSFSSFIPGEWGKVSEFSFAYAVGELDSHFNVSTSALVGSMRRRR